MALVFVRRVARAPGIHLLANIQLPRVGYARVEVRLDEWFHRAYIQDSLKVENEGHEEIVRTLNDGDTNRIVSTFEN